MNREEKKYKEWKMGNRAAGDELVGMYYADIYRYCRWHTKNQQQAEDATQEVFLKFFRYVDKYRDRGALKAFLYRIAENTCRDYAKRKCNSTEVSWMEDESREPSFEEVRFSEIESVQNFYVLIENLPEEQRELVILRYGQDLTMREISGITGLKLRTVQSRLRSALSKIEKEMGKE